MNKGEPKLDLGPRAPIKRTPSMGTPIHTELLGIKRMLRENPAMTEEEAMGKLEDKMLEHGWKRGPDGVLNPPRRRGPK